MANDTAYGTIELSLITPEKTFYTGSAAMVIVPGVEGDFGVLPGHAPFISAIRPGVIRIDTSEGQRRFIGVIGGFAEVVPERCTILADTGLDCANLNSAEIESRIQAAREKLAQAQSHEDRQEAEKHVALAEALKFIVGGELLN